MIDTGQHAKTSAPEVMDVFDADGADEYAMPAYLGGSVRSFRAPQGNTRSQSGEVSLSDPTTVRAGVHMHPGQPDERRQDTTWNGHPSGNPADAPEHYSNARTAVTISRLGQAPERPRQGFTGADPTRVALTTRPTMLRAFDKEIAEHPGQVLRADQAAPLAATPRPLGDMSGDTFPYAGGTTGTQNAGVGPARNTRRTMPRRWDNTLPAAPAQSSSRGRAFR